MSCRGSLEYTCPSHGGWGMVRIGMLIPECHQLFVCPSACGRHGALGAIQQGFKDRLSYLYLEESDIISGYDNAICEAVGELLKRLAKRPKVILVFVSCLDDLIGTDCDAVIDELSMRYPDVQFRMGHMNPIATDSDEPPLVNTWKNVYSLMEWSGEERKPAINMLGNYVPIHEKSEIFEIMKVLGVEIHHIGNYSTYEELRDMGNHYFNLLLSSKVEKAARLLKRTQGIEYVEGHITYDLKEIRDNYKLMFDKLVKIGQENGNEELFGNGRELSDSKKSAMEAKNSEIEAIMDEYEKKALKSIEAAREKIGKRRIYIDYSAFGKPLEAAKFFNENGFNISRVYVKDMDEDSEVYRWLLKETDIEIIKANKHDTVKKWKAKDNNGILVENEGEASGTESLEGSISVGMEAAYISGSPHVVPVFQNEGMYGFHGICLLMEKLCQSVDEVADLEKVIQQAGLVV